MIASIAMQIALYLLACLLPFFRGGSANSIETRELPGKRKEPGTQIITYSNRSIALSPPLLRELAEKDEIIYAVVRKHYEEREGNECYRQAVRRHMKHYETTSGSLILHFHEDGLPLNRPVNIAWNPLATYHLLNRFNTTLKQLVMTLSETDERQNALAQQILGTMRELGWPTEDDLHSAISSILRIQHFYDLNTTDISHGKIVKREYGISMSSEDCIVIGKQALTESFFYLAVEWFEEALRMINPTDPKEEQRLQHKIATNNIQLAKSTHDKEFVKAMPYDSNFFRDRLSQQPPNRERRRTYLHRSVKANAQSGFSDALYWGLCSGEKFMSQEEQSRLLCYYETKVNPAWYINPLKVEILSLNRLLVAQYHDILSESWIEELRSDISGSGRLEKSRTFGRNDQRRTSTTRTSTDTWIDDSVPEDNYIPRTVELISGLKADTKGLQVVAYSTGNHYASHMDARGWSEVEALGYSEAALLLHRIATFVFYLSNVIEGGATAFPMLGLAVTPIKGSAIMWYNLRRSGETHRNTWHASCPVIIGEKWIANKWILGSHQVVNPQYRCGKYLNASFGITVKGSSRYNVNGEQKGPTHPFDYVIPGWPLTGGSSKKFKRNRFYHSSPKPNMLSQYHPLYY